MALAATPFLKSSNHIPSLVFRKGHKKSRREKHFLQQYFSPLNQFVKISAANNLLT